ncbi:DinB family protein [Halobacillus salinus]|uniref:DinB family protein n=1 Tax=Halobacillus salinus TaxID=192814 RepID=A0A4Z0H0A1_9BACI|nr:DinB family protein [Halobacillus salinus]TGB03858.1 DinB family protein [Halobacillus salinus]
MIDYRIVSLEGYDSKIGELVSMLEHTRAVTLEELDGLSIEELDYVPDHHGNSIGALLVHIAAIEFVHRVISFDKRDLSPSEWEEWKAALQLGEEARSIIKGQPLSYHLDILSSVRQETLKSLQSKEDNWLKEEAKWDNGTSYNNHYLWFHVMEDEMNHRGQIRSVKRQLAEVRL